MIAVIGDIIVDEYIYGETTRLSPEAPVPIVKHLRTEQRSGGAANVYENIKSLTNDVIISVSCETPPRKIRVFSSGHYISRIDYEGNHEWLIDDSYKTADIVILSDYNKGCLDQIEWHALPKKTIVDPKKSLDHYKNCWILKPNKHEFESYAGKWNNIQELEMLMEQSIRKLGIEHLIVTLGQDGVAYCSNGIFNHYPVNTVEVYDVTGAGDTFIAVLAWALDNSKSIEESIILANKAASIAVSHLGTYIIKETDLELEKIVFTNGCFDILHIGHVEYLRKSKQLGTKLIVGLNSDESVKRLKGLSRPINNEHDRKKLLEEFDFIDEVLIFNEDTPYELIKMINPDIITKGGDYTAENVVGNNISKVVIIPLVKELSTTSIINKIKS